MQPPFFPTARQINWLLIVGFLAVGEALYLRYLVIEYAPVSLACQGGLQSWLCTTFRLVIVLYNHGVFGWVALIAAALNLVRPSIVLMTIALAAAGFGLVLHNTDLAGLAARCLFSVWRGPRRQQTDCQRDKAAAEPQRLPIGEGFAERDIDSAKQKRCRCNSLGAWVQILAPRPRTHQQQERDSSGRQRREREVAIARIEHKSERRLYCQNNEHDQEYAQRYASGPRGVSARRPSMLAKVGHARTP